MILRKWEVYLSLASCDAPGRPIAILRFTALLLSRLFLGNEFMGGTSINCIFTEQGICAAYWPLDLWCTLAPNILNAAEAKVADRQTAPNVLLDVLIYLCLVRP